MLSQAQSSETRRASTQAYYERLAIETSGRYPAFFMNGVAMPRDEGFFQSMALRLNQDLHALRQRVFEGVYDDDSWLPMFYLQHALTGRNSVVAPEDGTRVKLVETGRLAMPKSQAPMPIAVIPASDDASLDGMASIMLIADLDSPAGKQQLASLLSFRNDHPAVELTLVHSSRVTGPVSRHVVQHQLLDIPLLSDWLQSSIEADTTVELEPDTWYAMERLLRDLGLAPGDTAVMLNGRVVGPLSATTVLNPSALKILRSYEGSRHIAPVVSALKQLNLHDRIRHPSELAKVTSLLAVATETAGSQSLFDIGLPVRSPAFDLWAGDHTSFVVSKSDDPVVFVNATIDPASETAQRYLPLLRALAEFEGVRVHILLNPSDDLQELPVKRFYRDVLPAAPDFNADGTRVRPQARFENLPKSTLFTLSMDVPHAWLVAAQESVHDLDNIILSSVQEGSDVDAVYGLEYILVEGHSVDTTTRTPPRGVQLLLGTDSTPHDTDTIIMANLGYFQFKSRPGYWKMSLKPGPSDQIFNLQSIGANGQRLGPATSGDAHLTLMSFQGQTLFPRLSRKKGHEEDDVLAPSSAMGSARDYISRGWNFALSLLAPSSRNAAITPANAEINIFSVASGHLYERMLNIMMVSVMRHTTHTVKFWFIEQFLSPSFKEFLPHMAQEYGFDYEMVTYKWPHWLRPQSEKQREIWGYKILFLDVLFPLSLDKVIFVDADQIVRTDMYDLVQFDLEDAPYGFTPMCDSRESMEGFRFWKQGYWKSYLAGLPYHISALYVVDLARFRALAAGDRLRGQYQALSGDPNSLANLDQDLPNHMQRVLPIKSLPQDWLWCETWCSDEALKTARTIDLCNNPLTKEPKLDRARRQVPEWTEYDEEIAALARRVARKPSEVPAPEPEASPVAHEEL
ncbi:hypothetical protein KEM52_006638 [Ascosphaera acerosa]|nr:hypothetical protein KEM52_006638 [Ascosphaera acerosa]